MRGIKPKSLLGGCFLSILLALLFIAVPVLAGDEGAVKGSIVNVRQGPGLSYSVAAQVKKGQVLTVLEKKQEWLKVSTYNGTQGWISANMVELVVKKVTVTGSSVNTRKGPGTGYQKVRQVYLGQNLSVFAEKNGWYRVSVSGAAEEWIAGWLVSNANASSLGYVVVNTEVLNIRQGPGTNNAIVTKIGLNEQHNVLAEKNGWYKISVKNVEGWVSGDYVKYFPAKAQPVESNKPQDNNQSQGNNQPQDNNQSQEDKRPQENNTATGQLPKAVIVTGNVVNIRQWGSMEAPVVDQVNSGNALTVIDAQGDWYHVRLANGNSGWIVNWLTEAVESSVPSRSVQRKEVLIVPIATGKTFKVVDYGGRPELVLEGLSKEQYKIKQSNENKTLVLELQGPSTREYEGKIERLGIAKIKVYPQGNQAIIELAFNFIPVPALNLDNSGLVTTIQVGSMLAKVQGLVGKTIVLDAGHAVIQPGGWLDPGALGSRTKLKEKDVNLAIVLKLKSLLEGAGAKVVLTHTGSTGLSLAQRAEIANNLPADIFVSIHANFSERAGVSGHSTYFYAPYGNEILEPQRYERQKLATLVQKEMVKMGGRKDLGILEANFAVLRETRVPSILVETAFLSDPGEESLLGQDWYRQKLAEGIFNGIKAYFN